MSGEKNLHKLLANMKPILNAGEYVFVVSNATIIPREITICEMKEVEGTTMILNKKDADNYQLHYDYIASWITLNIHSSLSAVGLTAAISTELAENNISCNVIAGYYHDHIFVDKVVGLKALTILQNLANRNKL